MILPSLENQNNCASVKFSYAGFHESCIVSSSFASSLYDVSSLVAFGWIIAKFEWNVEIRKGLRQNEERKCRRELAVQKILVRRIENWGKKTETNVKMAQKLEKGDVWDQLKMKIKWKQITA